MPFVCAGYEYLTLLRLDGDLALGLGEFPLILRVEIDHRLHLTSQDDIDVTRAQSHACPGQDTTPFKGTIPA